MKRSNLLLLAFLLIPLLAFNYSKLPFIQKLIQSMVIFNSNFPEEKIYISTDKPFYKPGETIWLSAFLVEGKENKASSISDILHIEFINTKGNINKILHIKLDEGVGKAEIQLEKQIVGGIYKIRAYTKYMRLFNPNVSFEKTIQVQSVLIPKILMKLDFDRKAYNSCDTVIAKLSIRSIENQALAFHDYSYTVMLNGEKLYTKTELLNDSGFANIHFILPKKIETTDGLLNATVTYKGNTESISRSIPIVLNKIDLQFFPEGGYCVENVKTRVAFKAVNEFGKPADVEGQILDENKQVVVQFRSFHNGMGAFEFNPLKNKKYSAIITKPEKIEVIYQLPEIITEGFVLNAYKEKDKIKVRVYAQKKENVHLVAQTKGNIEFSKSFKTKKGDNFIEIPTQEFSSGITQITLFDKKENPVCIRLVFVNKQKLMNISITTDKKKYKPRENVIMKIKTTDENNNPVKANIAVSVVDDKVFTFADDKQDNILSYLLLSSDVKGKIEEPSFYFRKDEPKADEALDYLLMTQAWRRFEWKSVLKKDTKYIPDFRQYSEKLLVRGNIFRKDSAIPAKGIKIWSKFGDTLLTNSNGYFEFKSGGKYQILYLNLKYKPDSYIYLPGYSANSTYLNNRLNGIVYDAQTQEPLSNVDISLSHYKEHIKSVFNGFYSFYGISNKKDSIIFIKSGYKPKKMMVEGPILNCSMEKDTSTIEISSKYSDYKGFILKNKNKKSFNEILNDKDDLNPKNQHDDFPDNLNKIKDSGSDLSSFETVVDQKNIEEDSFVEYVYETFCIDEKSMFPGGSDELIHFFAEHIQYPRIAQDCNIEGPVIVKYMVDKDGKAKNPQVIESIDPLLEEEALRIIDKLPKFTPAKTMGNPVATWHILSIKFQNDQSPSILGIFDDNDYEICIKSEGYHKFHEARSFNACSYSSGDNERNDFSSTIYWNPSIKTNENGEAEISFLNNEDETTFVAVAEGISATGFVGRTEYRYPTQMNFSIDAKIPVNLSFYDKIQIPVNIVNNSDEEIKGILHVISPDILKPINDLPKEISVLPNSNKLVYLEYQVGTSIVNSYISISFSSNSLSDYIVKEIHVLSNGFPQNFYVSGNQWNVNTQFTLPQYIEGSLKIEFKAYPNIFADLIEGLKGMIGEPYGCFEQASSVTYPNILALQLIKQLGLNENNIARTANKYIEEGYKRLTGFETKQKGFEWFGNVPPHEGLTAYGLMEFEDMKAVYPQVEDQMIKRTALWLTSRKDGKGGFINNQHQHFGWGNNTILQNAYIVYALSEAGYINSEKELNTAYNEALESQDAYRMALVVNALFNYKETEKANQLLMSLVKKIRNFGFAGLKSSSSITYSSGESLKIETTALILMAIMKSDNPDAGLLNEGFVYILKMRKYGRFGSTQSTILALKAMCKYFSLHPKEFSSGSISLNKNDNRIGYINYNTYRNSILTITGLEEKFKAGKHSINITQKGNKTIPYSFLASWNSLLPRSDAKCMIDLSTNYATLSTKTGETVRLDIKLTNKTEKGLPMTIAKIGIPSGLSLQPWQLKEMQEKKLFDFYEVDKNYLIVYYTGFNPKETKEIKLDLKAEVPGTYNCPASCAYLYYTDEFKSWCGGEIMVVEK